MDDDKFYDDHDNARMFFEAMMYAGGFSLDGAYARRERNCKLGTHLSPIRKRSLSPVDNRKREVELSPSERFQCKIKNYNEVAEKNAQELIKEEEQAKIKSKKKKAKKDKQKNKKRGSAKSNSDYTMTSGDNEINTISSDMENLTIITDNKETEEIDISAAFVSKAFKKLNTVPTTVQEEPKQKNGIKDINSIIQLALEYKNREYFKEAIQYLSEAINLVPRNNDLLLKRSLIYYKLGKFEKSIRDAAKVIFYSPNNGDAYYRLGEAQFALKNLPEAEYAFSKLLRLNCYRVEAHNRLFSIRVKQLVEMGYHPNSAFTAICKSKNKTLNEAIEYLAALDAGEVTTDDLYYSDDEDESDEDESDEGYEEEEKDIEGASGPLQASVKPPIVINKKSQILTDPLNPLHCCSLFVGNMKEGISYKEVYDVFIKFGDIKSIKLTLDPACYAFVNYKDSDAAGAAMEALQNSRWLLSTNPLLIKYPINVINHIIANTKNPELILHKYEAPPSARPAFLKPFIKPEKKQEAGHTKKSPKIVECYFWRTTGCMYGKKCFNLHIPGHEGIALNSRASAIHT